VPPRKGQVSFDVCDEVATEHPEPAGALEMVMNEPRLTFREFIAHSIPPQTTKAQESYTSAQWPAAFSADAHAARFGSSGNGSDFKRSVTRHQPAT
jgi:hypothetical protein